tara:strand:- start:44 stop:1315 length:1272 start_codon:yes stop_codon:yes gene_type:complete
MENIIQSNNMVNFDFSNISLKNPRPVQGGSFLSTIKHNNEALIIQTPKIKTKKGITQTNKHIYADLVFENDDNEFIEWIESLQENVRDIILTKSDNWFHDPVTLDEIEYNWNDAFRTYKQTKQLLRTFIHKSKGISNNTLKIYDSDYKSKHINDIKSDTSIICILEITGLKFSSTTFQLDFCLRQVMILEDKPIFNEPLIKISKEEVVSKEVGEKNVVFNEKNEEITLEKLEESLENLEKTDQDIQVKVEKIKTETDISSNILGENLEEVSDIKKEKQEVKNLVTVDESKESDLKQVTDKNILTENNEISQFTNSVEEVNLDDLEKEVEPNDINKNKDELQEVNLTFDEDDAITLKNPNEIYLDIYKQAREKAKKAKQEAIKAYLEAKRIKELYMLEIVDSSEDESDSEEESEDGEDELFSEN